MKAITFLLLFLFCIITVRLSAQDTLQVKAPTPTDTVARSYPHAVNCLVAYYSLREDRTTQIISRTAIQEYAKAPKPVTLKKLKGLRIAAAVLSSVGGGVQIFGASLMIRSTTHAYNDNSFGEGLGGAILLMAGSGPAAAGIGTWIGYAKKLHTYKRQHASGSF